VHGIVTNHGFVDGNNPTIFTRPSRPCSLTVTRCFIGVLNGHSNNGSGSCGESVVKVGASGSRKLSLAVILGSSICPENSWIIASIPSMG